MTDEEKAIDVPGRQAKLAQLLNGAETIADLSSPGRLNAAVPAGFHICTRGKKKGQIVKDRVDKCVSRKLEPAQAGALHPNQIAHIDALNNARWQARKRAEQAEAEVMELDNKYYAYMEEITAKQ